MLGHDAENAEKRAKTHRKTESERKVKIPQHFPNATDASTPALGHTQEGQKI